mgnify:CR=1 FL=1
MLGQTCIYRTDGADELGNRIRRIELHRSEYGYKPDEEYKDNKVHSKR